MAERKKFHAGALAGAVAGVIITAAIAFSDPLMRWPLDLPRELSGTIGEQRGMYLHSGIDIRTKGRIGYPVYAVAAGRIVSVDASTKGYGNAVTIQHSPFASHYAHMNSLEERRYGLDTLMKIVKVLYNDKDVSGFTFTSTRLTVGAGDLIGTSGETGSGPPHLHFDVRVPGGVENPLKFLAVDDREAPVMTNVFVCVEKAGVTVREERYKLRKTGEGSYALDSSGRSVRNNTVKVGKDDRVFLKVACYDRLGTSNKCAIGGLELFDGGAKVFGIDLSGFVWSDSWFGRFIYDLSNLVIEGENVYTYYLCKRPGNRYSRISAGDGYLLNSASTRKVKVVASDYAGNRSTLEFNLAPDNDAKDPSAEFVAVKNGGGTVRDSSGNCTFRVYGGSLYENTMLRVASMDVHPRLAEVMKAASIPAKDFFRVYSVYPHDQLYKRDAHISIRRPDGVGREEAGKIFVCRFYSGGFPAALDTRYSAGTDTFEADTPGNGNFVLVRDTRPPRIYLPPIHELVRDNGVYRRLRFHPYDDLSGVSLRTLRIFIDGERFPFEFDFDRGWAEVTLPRQAMSKGLHHVFIKCSDRAGNETVFRNLLMFAQ